MKKLTYLSGTLASMATLLGVLFRILHWEVGPLTGGLLLSVGILSLAFIFIPSFASYNYNRSEM